MNSEPIRVGILHPNGEEFAKFCVNYGIKVLRDEDSMLIFNNQNMDFILELWNKFCKIEI